MVASHPEITPPSNFHHLRDTTGLDLERQQVWVYLAAILAGLGLGLLLPGAAAQLEAALWPLLGILIFVTFTQVPLI
ncbi:MAG: hypothetical protein ACK4GT_20685, partial [Pararhodobacter sp.]